MSLQLAKLFRDKHMCSSGWRPVLPSQFMTPDNYNALPKSACVYKRLYVPPPSVQCTICRNVWTDLKYAGKLPAFKFLSEHGAHGGFPLGQAAGSRCWVTLRGLKGKGYNGLGMRQAL